MGESNSGGGSKTGGSTTGGGAGGGAVPGSATPLMVTVTSWVEPSVAVNVKVSLKARAGTERLYRRQTVVEGIGPTVRGHLEVTITIAASRQTPHH